jgi:hypothetical protein
VRLEDVCERILALEFPADEDDAHPPRDAVVGVRVILREALATDELLVDCIAHELRLLEHVRQRSGLMPFFTIPKLGVHFAFGYWAPGQAPGPHEHTAWTVTAVCRNQLEVVTYDHPESYRRRELVQKNRFTARAHEVGFIYEPAIHAPRNTSADWSLSFHVTSPRDGEPVGGVEPLLPRPGSSGDGPASDHPYVRALKARERQRKANLLAWTLLSTQLPQRLELLVACFRIASSSARRMMADAMPEQFSAGASPRLLVRADRDLQLQLRPAGRGWGLFVDTPRGAARVLVVNDLAREAIAFAAMRPSFDVRELPGQLSEEERTVIADMLEETGTFHRVLA